MRDNVLRMPVCEQYFVFLVARAADKGRADFLSNFRGIFFCNLLPSYNECSFQSTTCNFLPCNFAQRRDPVHPQKQKMEGDCGARWESIIKISLAASGSTGFSGTAAWGRIMLLLVQYPQQRPRDSRTLRACLAEQRTDSQVCCAFQSSRLQSSTK